MAINDTACKILTILNVPPTAPQSGPAILNVMKGSVVEWVSLGEGWYKQIENENESQRLDEQVATVVEMN